MEKEKLVNFLNKFGYKYSERKDTIIVNLDFAQKVIINFTENDQIKISDKLTGWNFLTGLIEMSLKNAMIYNFIGGIITGILFFALGINKPETNLITFYLIFILWVLLFTVYYLNKLESFKIQIINAFK